VTAAIGQTLNHSGDEEEGRREKGKATGRTSAASCVVLTCNVRDEAAREKETNG